MIYTHSSESYALLIKAYEVCFNAKAIKIKKKKDYPKSLIALTNLGLWIRNCSLNPLFIYLFIPAENKELAPFIPFLVFVLDLKLNTKHKSVIFSLLGLAKFEGSFLHALCKYFQFNNVLLLHLSLSSSNYKTAVRNDLVANIGCYLHIYVFLYALLLIVLLSC